MNSAFNNVTVISDFVNSQIEEKENVRVSLDSVKTGVLYQAALKALVGSNEWLRDTSLTKLVFAKLETIEPQSVEEKANTAAIYMKLLNSTGQKQSVSLHSIFIKISDQQSVDLPKRLLMAKSENFGGSIDLSGRASEKTLNDFVSYLTCGKSDFITNKNAVEVLLLVKEYKLLDLSMKCLEYLLGPNRISRFDDKLLISEEESNLRQLLEEVKKSSITVTRTNTGILHIKMMDGSKKEQWDCLKKLHAYIPVTHLQLTENKNLDHFLDFVGYHPGIVSLDLGKSRNIDDEYLEKLSQNLSDICSFSIESSKIKAIPLTISDRVMVLNCRDCYALEKIDAPRVITLNCNLCRALKEIDVSHAVTLNCGNCALEKIDAPHAVTLVCSGCDALEKIDAPLAVMLDCNDCDALEKIDAPLVVTLNCFNCRALEKIDAPHVVTLNCYSCRALKEIDASHAVTIVCSGCRDLKEVEAPDVVTLDFRNCPGLSDEAKSKLFNIVRRNIVKTFYGDIDELNRHLTRHFGEAASIYGVHDAKASFIEQWFIDAQKRIIPADFNSEAERLACELEVTGLLEKLIAWAKEESDLKGSQIEWFNELKKLDSLQQQMNRINWFAGTLAGCAADKNPLADRDAISTLKAIGNLPDPFLQNRSTRALFSIYNTAMSGRKEDWKRLNTKRKDHLLLPYLLFTQAGINPDIIDEGLKGLETRNYKNSENLNPIIEMACLLAESPFLSVHEREKIAEILLKLPEIRPGRKIKAYRNEQKKGIVACRDLLHFGKGRELATVDNMEQLLECHKKACQTIFGVKEELLHTFNDTFKSERFPNGLFTYAARLQTLPDSEKTLLTKLLGEFVNGLLEGNFPDKRYDLFDNTHLNTIFKGKEELLTKWKNPLEIDLNMSDSLSRHPVSPPHVIAWDTMKTAIDNKHLGEDQESVYSTLVKVLGDDGPEMIPIAIEELTQKLIIVAGEIKSAPKMSEAKKFLEKQASALKIEINCLKALDPSVDQAKTLGYLLASLRGLPAIEFKHDIQGIIDTSNPAKNSKAKWMNIRTTESWEDLLLMGTEVSSSCQRIDGDPHYNKCLLAYIMDGKNKPVIVTDSEGKIAARSVLRILWNEKQRSPVLFMERIYTKTADPALSDLITRGCVEKAKEMGLPLVASRSRDFNASIYADPLSALGGPAPFEYVDALSGIQKNGKFTIPTSKILYMPGAP